MPEIVHTCVSAEPIEEAVAAVPGVVTTVALMVYCRPWITPAPVGLVACAPPVLESGAAASNSAVTPPNPRVQLNVAVVVAVLAPV